MSETYLIIYYDISPLRRNGKTMVKQLISPESSEGFRRHFRRYFNANLSFLIQNCLLSVRYSGSLLAFRIFEMHPLMNGRIQTGLSGLYKPVNYF